jgi:glycosyltransferase involved in cell wall biosynthesis
MGRISIALCTYNGSDFLNEQLKSFLAQTKLPDELVICDDSSEDETVEIVKEFAKSSPFPVRIYVNEQNLGSTKNFERAISLCTGDIIFLSDQDDVWRSDKIELMYDGFAKSKNTGLVFSDAEVVNENLKTLKPSVLDFSFAAKERAAAKRKGLFTMMLKKNVVIGATMAFRREYKNFFMPIPAHLPNVLHDGWIALITSAVSKTVCVEKPLIKYRQHPTQQLGINSKFLKNNSQSNHRIVYSDSIKNLRKELKKLSLLSDILNEYPQFQKRVVRSEVDSLINECRREIIETIRHYENRMNLSPSRLKRVLPIYKEVKTGRYHRFSKGLKSAAKDIYENW